MGLFVPQSAVLVKCEFDVMIWRWTRLSYNISKLEGDTGMDFQNSPVPLPQKNWGKIMSRPIPPTPLET